MKTFNIPIEVFDANIKFHVDFTPEQAHKDIQDDEAWCCFKNWDWNCDIWIWDSKDIRSLVHECNHAVNHILEIRDIKDEECHCYLLDYIVWKYILKLNLILCQK